jgi:hypothetical protein
VLPAGKATGSAFGGQPIGSPTEEHVFTFALPPTDTLSSTMPVQVLTQGAPGLDFQNVLGQTTCGVTFLVANGCSVAVSFLPTAAGQRNGAIVLYGSDGGAIATKFIDGVGTGPQVAFDPGAPTAFDPPALKWNLDGFSPVHIAVDGAGNAYVAAAEGEGIAAIYKFNQAGDYSSVLASIAGGIGNMAVDGAGNLYYIYAPGSGGAESVMELVDGAPKPVITGLTIAEGLAVGPSGNVFVSLGSGTSAGSVWKFTPATGAAVKLPIGSIAGKALNNPLGIAVDGNGNLFINDEGNGRIVKVPPSGSPSVVLDVSPSSAPDQIAVGGNGDLYIAMSAGQEITKLTPAGEMTSVLSGNEFGQPLSPGDLAVDGWGNLYIVSGNGRDVLFINRTTNTASFGNLNVGVSNSQTFTLENIGNETLEFAVGVSKTGVGHNAYTLPPAYALTAADTCPIAYEKTAVNPKYSLAADADCEIGVSFDPAGTGADNGAMVITDNALNGAPAEQTVALTGSGNVQITFVGCPLENSVPDCGATYTGSPIPVTVATVPAGLAVAITYKAATSTLPTKTPPTDVGDYTVSASVTTPGVMGSLAGTLTIGKATPVVTWPAPATITFPTLLSATQLDATVSPNIPGTLTYYNASASPLQPIAIGTVLPAGTYQLEATFIPADGEDYFAANQLVTLKVMKPTWSPSPLNFGNVIEGTDGPFMNVTLTNNGTSSVNCTSTTYASGGSVIGAPASIGLHLAGLTASSGTTAALPPGAACAFTFIYEPTAVASLSVTMTIAGVTPPLTITAAAILPPVTLAPATVNFGTVDQGQTNTQTLTLTNNTSGTLAGITTMVNPGTTTYYILQPAPATTCTASLAAKASCVYSFEYAPTATTPNIDSAMTVTVPYSYTTDEGAFTAWVTSSTLEGRNVSPAQAVLTSTPSPAVVQEAVGGRSSAVTFILTNNCGETLTGLTWAASKNLLTGPGASAFTLIAGPSCTEATSNPPTSLQGSGGQCLLVYDLASAAAPGTYTAILTIGTALGPRSATLTGVVYPVPTLAPPDSGAIFNNIPLNTPSAPFKVTLANPTPGPVTITSASVVPAGTTAAAAKAAGNYKVTTTCGATLAAAPAGQPPTTCTYTIVFTPTSEDDGEFLPTFTVNTSFSAPAPLGTQMIALTSILIGTVQPLPVIVLNPNPPTLSFPSQTVGTVSNAQTATLSNTATLSQVTLIPPVFTGAGADEFNVTVKCDEPGFTTAGAGTLDGANGAMCSYSIVFAPVASGPSTIDVTMTIPTNAPSGNAVFTLTGSALPAYTGRVVWIPDFEGQLLQVRAGTGATAKAITVQLPATCNPTSVTVNLAYAFVFCSSAAGHTDELLAYDANVIRDSPAGTIDPAPLATWARGPSELDGADPSTGVLDAAGNLWYSANQEPGAIDPALFKIPASEILDGALPQFLSTPGILVPVGLTNFNLAGDLITTISPTGMTFAPDGSLWISGSEYHQEGPAGGVFGILLNIPASQLNSFEPTPFTCLTTDPDATKCSTYTGAFNDPGGVAVFNKMLWVSVTGAAQFGVTTALPGRELIGFPLTLAATGDTLGTPVSFGSAASPTESPFVCPGGLFAQAAGAVHLWVNDDSFGDSSAKPTCGGAGDTASQAGGVFDYTANQLSNHDATLNDILAYTDVTGRPGPGGIFVENDQ